MRVAQITLRNASEYERKCRRVDRVALAGEHEIVEDERGADIVHVYGAGVRRPRLWSKTVRITPLQDEGRGGEGGGGRRAGETAPRQGGGRGARGAGRRWLRSREPRLPPAPCALRPVEYIPEAVEEQYLAHDASAGSGVGVFVRLSTREMLDQMRIRLHRTRAAVEWPLFARVPTPDDLVQVAVWLDPALDDGDFDGFVAEALAMGRLVVASRTPINVQRLEKGRCGFLVPPRDANETVHAILTALFKPEVGTPRSDAARQTVSKFKPRQRARALTRLYERLRS